MKAARNAPPVRPSCVAALALLALACGEVRLGRVQPHAGVDRTALDFGETPIRFPVERVVLVSSVGQAPLHVSIDSVAGAAFSAPFEPALLAAGEVARVRVLFTPPATGPFTGTLTLSTNDPDQPSIAVALTGTGTFAASLRAAPAAVDFGRVGEGETATRELQLDSLGPADLYLASVGLASGTSDAFGLVGSLRLPATLAAGSGVKLGLRFSPTPDTTTAQGAFRIESSDALRPEVLIAATGSINRAPVAVARGSVGGGAQATGALEAAVGAVVDLDATGSSDPDGDVPLTFAWRLDARPAGSTAAIAGAAAAQAQLRLDAAGVYSVLLVATDAAGLPSFVPARLDLRAAPAERLVVELVWDKAAPDIDLHFLQPGAALESAQDCFWANASPAWFAGGTDANPQHGGDQLVGYGPERVTWKLPQPGTWAISVVYKADHGAQDPSTTAQVRVYAQGVLVASVSKVLKARGEVWAAATVDWPSGRVVGVAP